MEWKKDMDEMLADELEEQIIDYVKAGFLSDEEILEYCEEYIEDEYPEEADSITDDDLLNVIETYRDQFQNGGGEENFRKLDTAFQKLDEQGIVCQHCAGYVQSDGFDDCNEIATERYNNGEKIIGCCFYTMQDLEPVLHEESDLLYFSFGNYFEEPAAEEIGRIIVKEFEAMGFAVQWPQTADAKIAIQNMIWDKRYSDDE